MDSPGQRIARVVTPLVPRGRQRATEANQRPRSGVVELALQTLANLVERVPSGQEGRDRRDQRLTADGRRHRRGLRLEVHCCTNPFPVGNRFSPASIATASRFSAGGSGQVVYGEYAQGGLLDTLKSITVHAPLATFGA